MGPLESYEVGLYDILAATRATGDLRAQAGLLQDGVDDGLPLSDKLEWEGWTEEEVPAVLQAHSPTVAAAVVVRVMSVAPWPKAKTGGADAEGCDG